MLDEELGVDPDDLCVRAGDAVARLDHVADRRRRRDGVERACELAPGRVDDPVGEIADVDHLRRRIGGSRCEHASAFREPLGPVREPPGRVPRPDDQPGSRDERIRMPLAHNVLAESLQRAVGLASKLLGFLDELRDRRALVRGRRQVGVDRHRRDERVVADVGECVECRAHDPRHVAARVDHRVEPPAVERAEISVAVAAQLLGVGEELGPRLAAIEHRHFVAVLQCRLDHGAAEELCTAEHEDAHRLEPYALVRSPRRG